uniref:Uncharacterized protein n=1 Tax=Arundo donax TaxID=35708 RepID=A0A0A8Y945_ARUDO
MQMSEQIIQLPRFLLSLSY